MHGLKLNKYYLLCAILLAVSVANKLKIITEYNSLIIVTA